MKETTIGHKDIPASLFGEKDLDCFEKALETVRASFDATLASLYRQTEQGDFVPVAATCSLDGTPLVLATTGLAEALRNNGQTLLVIDPKSYLDLLVGQGAARFNLGCMWGGTISPDEGALFALCVGFEGPCEPTDPQRSQFRCALDCLQGLLVTELQREGIRQSRDDLAALTSVQAQISQVQNLDAALALVVRKARDLVNADASYVALADNDRRTLRVTQLYGCFTRKMQGLEQPYGTNAAGNVASTRKPIYVPDITLDPYRWNEPDVADALAAEGIVSGMAVPMVTNGRLVGVLSALGRRPDAFSDEKVQVLQRLGSDAAVAIENARLYDVQQATIHELNRRTNAHRMFLELAVQNAGMGAIAEALSLVVEADVLIEDADGREVAWATGDGRRGEFDGISNLDLLNNPSHYPQLAQMQSRRQAVLVPATSQAEAQVGPRTVVPVFVSGLLLGTAGIMGETDVDGTEGAILDLAAMTIALEFKKNEAARSVVLQRTLVAQENERKRIARELHDGTTQDVAAISIALDTALLALERRPEQAPERIEECKRLADHLLDGLNHAIADLRPVALDQLGLLTCLKNYALQRLAPLGISSSFDGDSLDVELDPFRELMFYRVLQEALSNVARHSKASKVQVTFAWQRGWLVARVADDGVGFDPLSIDLDDPASECFGLKGMRERIQIMAGEMSLSTAPGKGLTIEARIPQQASEEVVYGSYD